MRVSESGYYEWLKRRPSRRSIENEELKRKIIDVHEQSRGTYGRRRVLEMLKKEGLSHSVNRIGRIMKRANLQGISPRKFRVTTIPNHSLENSPNLLKGLSVKDLRPNEVWISDITYVPTDEGWLYLCVVIDLSSRRVLGMSMDKRMKASLVKSALEASVKLRGTSNGVIFHSDCGGQYKSRIVRGYLARKGLLQSRTHAGNCYDNAFAESFFGTLKSEIGTCQFKSREEAESVIFEYIEVFYNRKRMHSGIGYCSPEEFEKRVA